MEAMRRVAYATVLRACAFGSLTIFCFMVGLSFEPRIAFQTGGVLTMLMTGILFVKAQKRAPSPIAAPRCGSTCPTRPVRRPLPRSN